MITNKKHKQIIEHKEQDKYNLYQQITRLEKELEQAKDLKSILEKLSEQSNHVSHVFYAMASGGGSKDSLKMSDGETSFEIFVDKRTSKPVLTQDAVKLIQVFSNGTTKIKYTHKDNLSKKEKEEFNKKGFIVV